MAYRIFLVEDHPAMQEAYAMVLEPEDDLSLCGAASSAEDALDRIREEPYDLVVTDIRLPGMTGVELVERLHDLQPALRTLVITGHEETLFMDRARRAGASAFLPKRMAATLLIPTIRAVLQGETPDWQDHEVSGG